jgi:hypothetical protein
MSGKASGSVRLHTALWHTYRRSCYKARLAATPTHRRRTTDAMGFWMAMGEKPWRVLR